MLYRPPIGQQPEDCPPRENVEASATQQSNATTNAALAITEDPPPKYTPPPSYTTATGARIAKLLRQSIRRSVRRLANVLGESSGNSRNNRNETQQQQLPPPPPNYNDVLVEMNQNQLQQQQQQTIINLDIPTNQSSGVIMTAADVASILRNSFRRSTRRALNTLRRTNAIDSNTSSLSAENLVASAAPIGETSLVLETITNDDRDDVDSHDKANNFESVIR